jgi:hypothetical protein
MEVVFKEIKIKQLEGRVVFDKEYLRQLMQHRPFDWRRERGMRPAQ